MDGRETRPSRDKRYRIVKSSDETRSGVLSQYEKYIKMIGARKQQRMSNVLQMEQEIERNNVL